jgi:hypothetical protein
MSRRAISLPGSNSRRYASAALRAAIGVVDAAGDGSLRAMADVKPQPSGGVDAPPDGVADDQARPGIQGDQPFRLSGFRG